MARKAASSAVATLSKSCTAVAPPTRHFSQAVMCSKLGGTALQHVVLWRFTPDLDQRDQVELRYRVEASSNASGRMRLLRFAQLLSAESV